jgi:hypothetical protein
VSEIEDRLDLNCTWPSLPLDILQDTYATLHMWTQIVGKIRLTLTPLVNHYWNVTLYLTSRGLTTSAMPHSGRVIEIRFDFIDHNLEVTASDGARAVMSLRPCSVADFYGELMAMLDSRAIEVKIHAVPDEVRNPLPFAKDRVHSSYDPEYAHRFWRILVQADRVFNQFRSRFIGKCSPVHFFWGSFDLAVTRFSGRRAPARPGADAMTREAYSHECISHGFWPGGGAAKEPYFYSYTAPAPAGLDQSSIKPPVAFYSNDFSEFLLPYSAVRTADSPDEVLLNFMQSTYEAGANLAHWDRDALERR